MSGLLNARWFGSQLARSCMVFPFHTWKNIVVPIPTSFCHQATMAGLVPFTMGYTVGKSVPEFCLHGSFSTLKARREPMHPY